MAKRFRYSVWVDGELLDEFSDEDMAWRLARELESEDPGQDVTVHDFGKPAEQRWRRPWGGA